MQFITDLARYIICLYVSWRLRNKKVFVICGMRRSGNHACINWLLNALEEVDTAFVELKGDRVSISESQKTIFFNEVNFCGLRFYLRLLSECKSALSSAQNVIISLEDYIPYEQFDPYFPKNATTIIIKRALLNLIASRLQRAINQAKSGKDRGDMSIDKVFFKRLYWIDSITNGKNLICWSFDEWLLNRDSYRQKFLEKLELNFNLTPKMSTHGGGSSFTGESKIPSTAEVQSRWDTIDWPERVLDLLKENRLLLSNNELKFLSKKTK